jgi:hypothetical protein
MDEAVDRRHTYSKLSSSDIGEVILETDRFLQQLKIGDMNKSKDIQYLEEVRDDTGVLGTIMRLLVRI